MVTNQKGLSDTIGSPFVLHTLSQHIAEIALDFLFPPRCVGCRRGGYMICPTCLAELPRAEPVQHGVEPLTEVRSAALFGGPIQTAIHKLKYENQPRFAKVLIMCLEAALQRADWPVTLITAIPLHPAKLKARGYNQSALLGQQLGQRINIPFRVDAVARVRETQPQVGLSYGERQANMAHAFEADPTVVRGENIVIVDDVFTTGATLRNCAIALMASGAAQVWGLTVASAHGRPDVDRMLTHP